MITVPLKVHENDLASIPYDTKQFPIYIRQGKYSMYPNRGTMLHWHEDFEFIVVKEGTLHYNVNGTEMIIHQDEGIFINSKQSHYGYATETEDCSFQCFIIHPSILTEALQKEYIQPLIDAQEMKYVILKQSSLWQKELLRLLDQMFDMRDLPMYTTSYFLQILILLYENKRGDAKTKDQDDFYLHEMVGFIQTNYHRPITLSDIANSAHISQTKCNQLFTNVYHISPIHFLNNYRLDRSAYLLEHTKMPMMDIALSSGFNDASYFSKQFKEWSSETPRQYRKKRQLA